MRLDLNHLYLIGVVACQENVYITNIQNRTLKHNSKSTLIVSNNFMWFTFDIRTEIGFNIFLLNFNSRSDQQSLAMRSTSQEGPVRSNLKLRNIKIKVTLCKPMKGLNRKILIWDSGIQNFVANLIVLIEASINHNVRVFWFDFRCKKRNRLLFFHFKNGIDSVYL